MSRILIAICISLLLVSASYAFTPMVIGNWEDSSTSEGWGNWDSSTYAFTTGALPFTANGITYSQGTVGATLGSYSLGVTESGWCFGLAVSLNAAEIQAFRAHTTFSIDVSVAASGGTYSSGYSEVAGVIMNTSDSSAGWTTMASNPITYYWWSTSPARTQTITINYSDYIKNIVGDPSWVQILFTMNCDNGETLYFDNAQLTPEPATMALLGLGGLALIRRKR